ncbi:thermonuclease family protein [Paenibacillus sp. J2TS4]|uniref:thermonuclease family protein n=1 Tax=Paenibacillus sp. J2TS4 TaxID=2807194 RepID=UPI001B042F08|nr:thermonuclease family protein [Paenibacillus sp. J2TS4]GIP34155.1 hypothetical protein J2TS4_33650 [Paenibacillus sp. J2TS4]
MKVCSSLMDVSERDKYGRLLAYLWVDDRMFNEMLLERGLARVAYVYPPNIKHVDRFRGIQKEAQQQGIGIWSIEDYAREDGFNPEAVATIDSAQASSEPAVPSGESSGACSEPTIKGNHSSSGEWIYHVPGGQFYDKTQAEEMFCTEEEAEAAGYRKSKR